MLFRSTDEDSFWNNIIDWLYNDRRGDSDKTQDIDNNDDNNDVALFASGGVVKGPGGVDNVDAKLTAGEFVMTKKAVNKWGIGFFESLNAMVGSRNDGHLTGRYEEGGIVTEEQDNITEELLKASKLVSLKIGEEININNPPNREDYPRTVTGFKEFKKAYKEWIKNNPSGTKFGQKVEPSNTISELTPAISSLMDQLKNTGEEIKPQLKDTHDQIKEVIDTPEVQDKIQSIKTKMKGVVEEITPERKGQIITIPIGSNSSNPFTVIPVPMKESHKGGRSKQLNTNEYYKHLTTLVTAYT